MQGGAVGFLVFLVALAAAGPIKPSPKARFPPNKLQTLPGLKGPLSSDVYSGWLPIEPNPSSRADAPIPANNALFYMFFESQRDPQNDPLILWLNGGPGATSFLGCFIENGPYRIEVGGSLTHFQYAWNKNANMIFVDQPIGTGYSYGNYLQSNQVQVGQGMFWFLQYFYDAFPSLKSTPFYVTGESYAGKYIPSITTAIFQANNGTWRLPPGPWAKVPLVSLAIGNGWVHPLEQNRAYVDYPYILGLISTQQRDAAAALYAQLSEAIISEQWDFANDLSNKLEGLVVEAAGVNEDNILYEKDPMQPLIDELTRYMNSQDMRDALHVPAGLNFTFENETVANAFNADEQKSVAHLLPNLIANYRVYIYTANMDLNCNIAGVEAYLADIHWKDHSKYYAAPHVKWFAYSQLAGYAQNYGNLTTIVIRNAGHEAPFYQPVSSFDMIQRILNNQTFG